MITSYNNYSSAMNEVMGSEALPPAIGTQERRLQVRAYNHWVGLLGNRSFPHSENLKAEKLPDFSANSVILKFPHGPHKPELNFIGEKLVEESQSPLGSIHDMSDIPEGSLIARIVEHYPQLLENKAPVGFEAEFASPRGCTILYRGILLPFSSDDERVDHILGVINWRELADVHLLAEIQKEIGSTFNSSAEQDNMAGHFPAVTGWADGPHSFPPHNIFSRGLAHFPPHVAERLRKLPIVQTEDCIPDNKEFALALVRRDADGKSHLIAGIPDNADLLEQAVSKLVN